MAARPPAHPTTRIDSHRLRGPVLFSHPTSSARRRLAGWRCSSGTCHSRSWALLGCVPAIAGVSAAPVLLAGAGMELHVAADVLTLCRFQRTLR